MRPSVRRRRARAAVVPSALVLSIGVAAACLTQGGAHAAPAAAPPAAAEAAPVADLVLEQSGVTVYPVHDGFHDTVAFVASAVDATDAEVPVRGTATLRHDGTTVTTWPVDGARSVLDWDGRVGGRVEPGRYDLTVDAASADGTERTATTVVAVSDRHLVHRSLTVDYPVSPSHVSLLAPMRVVEAAALGPVHLRIRTVASVRHPAALVVRDDGARQVVPLRSGTRLSAAHAVPRGFGEVVITHDWARGAAHLKTLTAIWEFDELR